MERKDDSEKKYRVLFICLGNICRSPAAEAVMRAVVDRHGDADLWHIDSAGIGSWHVGDLADPRMRRAASRRGYNLVHRCRQLKAADFDDFDLIIGMDSQNIADIRARARTADDLSKIRPMSTWLAPGCGYDYVPDPYYEGAEGFELVLDLLEDGCERLYSELVRTNH